METMEDVIRKRGSKYCVLSEKGKNLGCSKSKHQAHVRLGQVEFFKKRSRKKK
jgi:ribosomal protein L27